VGGAGLLVIRASSHVAFPFTVEALVPTRRPEFVFVGMATVYQPAHVVGRVSLATELSFP
jgi:hypothetical protein